LTSVRFVTRTALTRAAAGIGSRSNRSHPVCQITGLGTVNPVFGSSGPRHAGGLPPIVHVDELRDHVEKISGAALQALNTIDANTWMLFNPALGVMMLGAAGLLLTARTHRRLGWAALALGVLAFVPYADFFALLGTLLWIVVTSIVVARARQPEAGYAAAPGAA
jgi:hypothetical protein